jgi:hypothetical protein
MPNHDSLGASPNPQLAFEAFNSFVAQFDPIDLLSQLTLTFLFTQETAFIGEASPVRLWARWIEFTAGYLATRPIGDERYAAFDGNAVESFENLIKQYFNSLPIHLWTDRLASGERTAADRLLMSAKIESLYVRGDACPHQFLEYASELYGQHDQWFNSNLGFTIDDAIRIARSVPVELERRVNESAAKARTDAPRRAEEFLLAGEAAGLTGRELELSIACQLHFGAARHLLSFTVEEMAEVSGVGMNVCKAFLKRMSQRFGYRNPLFPGTFADATKAPWDYNCVDERPFLERENKFWMFTNSMLPSVLFYTFYFDLMADGAYRSIFERSRGAFVELKVKNYAARVFPKEAVLLNPDYPNGDEFSDVAVLYDGKVLIFQCKAKGFARSARIGEDFARLRADMQAGIRAAFDQALRARKYIHESEEAVLRSEGAELHINTKQITDIYLINVTLMPFHALTTRFENIEDALGLFPEKEYPLSLSVGNLDIVSQLLDSPAKFLHYVNRRLNIEKTAFDLQADELDLLGFYLAQGMYFTSEEFQGLTTVGLSGFSEEIDEYVHRKYDKHEQVERPQAPVPPGFSALIRDIESLRSMYRTDCAIALLDMSGPARSKTMEVIEAAKSATRGDGKEHSVSTGAPEHSRGFSFVSVADADSVEAVFQAAFSFAALKKYAERFDEWFGLGWRLGSPATVDVALMLKFPWQKDEVMEAAVQQFIRPGRRIDLR